MWKLIWFAHVNRRRNKRCVKIQFSSRSWLERLNFDANIHLNWHRPISAVADSTCRWLNLNAISVEIDSHRREVKIKFECSTGFDVSVSTHSSKWVSFVRRELFCSTPRKIHGRPLTTSIESTRRATMFCRQKLFLRVCGKRMNYLFDTRIWWCRFISSVNFSWEINANRWREFTCAKKLTTTKIGN